MRVYGRTPPDEFGVSRWIEVSTSPDGSNDYVYILALIQCIRLQLGESPFYSDWGIPAQQSVLTQIPPDVYVARMQERFAPHFASLIISRTDTPISDLKQEPVPTYSVKILLHNGVRVNIVVNR